MIAVQPVSQVVAGGSTVVFTVTPSGTVQSAADAETGGRTARAVLPTTYQWQFNGEAIFGATSAQLVIPNATASNSGTYTCVLTTAGVSAVSSPAALTVATTTDAGRLTNLSVLTDITSSVPSFTVGTVIGGQGTSGPKPLVVRAAGPALGALGVPNTLNDPKVDLFAGQTVVATNDNWNGDANLTTAMASVGAFAYASASSKDAAIFSPALAPRDYTVAVNGVGGTTGTVIAEVYDATPASTYSGTTPRLINVSVLKQVNSGSFITLGFTIGGSTAKTVLVRAIGPGLTQLGVPGVMADPQLTLFNSSSTAIATNDDWGGDAALSQTMTRVNAFQISDAASKDAMLLVTLPPGGYTAQARGGSNSSGLVIVEAYEVP